MNTRCDYEVHLSYSPDLAPNVFWLFPKTKSALKTEDCTSSNYNSGNIIGLSA